MLWRAPDRGRSALVGTSAGHPARHPGLRGVGRCWEHQAVAWCFAVACRVLGPGILATGDGGVGRSWGLGGAPVRERAGVVRARQDRGHPGLHLRRFLVRVGGSRFGGLAAPRPRGSGAPIRHRRARLRDLRPLARQSAPERGRRSRRVVRPASGRGFAGSSGLQRIPCRSPSAQTEVCAADHARTVGVCPARAGTSIYEVTTPANAGVVPVSYEGANPSENPRRTRCTAWTHPCSGGRPCGLVLFYARVCASVRMCACKRVRMRPHARRCAWTCACARRRARLRGLRLCTSLAAHGAAARRGWIARSKQRACGFWIARSNLVMRSKAGPL